MIKLFLLLLLSSTYVVAQNDIKLKAKQKHDIVQVKATIQSLMYGEEEAKKRGKESEYIIHVTAQVDGEIVYDVSTSPYLYRNPTFKFNYDYKGRDDTIEIIAIDNKSKQITKSRKIKNSRGQNKVLNSKSISFKSIDYRAIKPKIWDIISIDDAIKELYGLNKIIDEKNKEQICTIFGDSLKFSIVTKENTNSIAVFQDNHFRPTVAVFNTPKDENINYTLDLSTERDDNQIGGEGKIITILESIDGRLHKIEQNFVIAGHHEFCNEKNEVENYF